MIYVVSGRARMKWGDRLEFTAEAGPGDFIYVPPFVPHQEINASDTEPLSCVLCRSGQEPVVVNLDLPNVEPNPEEVHWVDNIHPAPGGPDELRMHRPGSRSRGWRAAPRSAAMRASSAMRTGALRPRRRGRDEMRDVLRDSSRPTPSSVNTIARSASRARSPAGRRSDASGSASSSTTRARPHSFTRCRSRSRSGR